MATGFRCWNSFEHDILLLRQLYDFTVDLYSRENAALATQRTEKGPGKSIHTNLGTVTHNVNRLFEYTKERFPNKLSELLLVSSITYLEGFLVELVSEIAERTLEPFKIQGGFEIPKGQALSYASIDSLREDFIRRETRQLTNAGLKEFAKYFRAKFGIQFSNLGVNYNDILEIHERRHLYVHRDGICDSQFAQRYPSLGFRPGDRVPVDQAYLIAALDLLKEFGSRIKDAAFKSYPDNLRRKRTLAGGLTVTALPNPPLLVKLEVTLAGFDAMSEIPQIPVKRRGLPVCSLHDLTYNMIQEEGTVTLILAGTAMDIKSIMYALKHRKEFKVGSASPVFNLKA